MTDPMPTDFRALCAELVDCLEKANWPLRHKTLFEICLADARAALAQPESQEMADEELLSIEDLQTDWNAQADAFNSWDELGIDEIVWWAQRQALARWGRPAIEPVPVSERLPGPEDCDAEERCWWWHEETGDVLPHWVFAPAKVAENQYLTWLPHWALPVPKREGEQ